MGVLRGTPVGQALLVVVGFTHASSVSPILMSVDYQVPVRIGSVTSATLHQSKTK